jgi:hypothetical protein
MEDGLRVCVGVDEPMGGVITSGCESSASERVLRPASGCWELCVSLQVLLLCPRVVLGSCLL